MKEVMTNPIKHTNQTSVKICREQVSGDGGSEGQWSLDNEEDIIQSPEPDDQRCYVSIFYLLSAPRTKNIGTNTGSLMAVGSAAVKDNKVTNKNNVKCVSVSSDMWEHKGQGKIVDSYKTV